MFGFVNQCIQRGPHQTSAYPHEYTATDDDLSSYSAPTLTQQLHGILIIFHVLSPRLVRSKFLIYTLCVNLINKYLHLKMVQFNYVCRLFMPRSCSALMLDQQNIRSTKINIHFVHRRFHCSTQFENVSISKSTPVQNVHIKEQTLLGMLQRVFFCLCNMFKQIFFIKFSRNTFPSIVRNSKVEMCKLDSCLCQTVPVLHASFSTHLSSEAKMVNFKLFNHMQWDVVKVTVCATHHFHLHLAVCGKNNRKICL